MILIKETQDEILQIYINLILALLELFCLRSKITDIVSSKLHSAMRIVKTPQVNSPARLVYQ